MESFTVGDVSLAQKVFISLVLGLLVGLQRQWAVAAVAGIRTFALCTVFGTLCAYQAERYGSWFVGLGLVGTMAVMVLARYFFNKTKKAEDPGVVTEFALLLSYVIGTLIYTGPLWFAIVLAGCLTVILQAKIELHGLVKKLSTKDLQAIARFVLISLVILPVVPNKAYDPLNVLNPHHIWFMVVVVVAISLAGYIVYKFYGTKAGVLASGVLGGLISSTATTLSYARKEKEHKGHTAQNALIILIAWSVVHLRLLVVTAIVAPSFQEIRIPLFVMFLLMTVPTLRLWSKRSRAPAEMPDHSNPTELKSALTFGALYAIILFAVAFAKTYFSKEGFLAVTVLSGISDVDAITLTTSRLVNTGQLLAEDAWTTVIVALIANNFFKGAVTYVIGGQKLAMQILLPWLCSMVGGLALLIF